MDKKPIQTKVDNPAEEINRLKAELESQRTVFESIVEGAMAGWWDWNIQENTEYLSPAFKSMFGYEDHEMENSPEAWQKIIHPDDLVSVFEIFNEHVRTKGEIPFDNEVRYFHKDGSIVWVFCRGKVVEWADDGSPIRMVGTHVNVTDLKAAREEKTKSERSTRALLNAIPDIMFKVSGDGTYLHKQFNEEDESRLLIPWDEMKGKKKHDIFPKDTADVMVEKIQLAIKTAQTQLAEYSIVEHGLEKFYESRFVKTGEDEVLQIIRDVSEAKVAAIKERSVYNIGKTLARAEDIQEVWISIHTEVSKVLEASNFYVALYDEKTGEYEFPYNGDGAVSADLAQEDMENSLTEYVRSTEEGLIAKESDLEALKRDRGLESIGKTSRAWLGVPLQTETKVIGVIAVQSYDDEDAYSENDLEFLEFVAGQVGESILRRLEHEARVEGEARFKELTDTIKEAFWLTDWKTRKSLYISPAYERVYGHSVESYEQDNSSWEQHIHPDDAPYVKANYEHNAESGEYDVEFRVIHPNGDVKWVHERAFPIFENGEVVRMAGYSADITERMEALEKLRESEERFRSLFERNLCGVYRATKDDRIVECNDAFARIMGFENREEVVGKHAREIYQNIDQHDFPSLLEDNMGGVTGFRSLIKLNSGRRVWILENASLVRDRVRKMMFVEGSIIDITKLMEAEKEIAQLAKFPEQNPNPVLRVSWKNEIIYVNKSGENLLDHISTANNELVDDLRMVVDSAFKKKESIESEHSFMGRHYLISVNPIIESRYANLYVKDITERKNTLLRLEAEKKAAHQYQSMLLTSQLNPHFIFNALNSIQYYILDQDPEPALDYLSNFARLMRTVLDNSTRPYISLENEMEFLDLYLNLEVSRHRGKFDYKIGLEGDIDPAEILIPPMVLQPYVENTVIHGVGNLTEGGEIEIVFKGSGDEMHCEIIDNGVGRREANRLKIMRNGKKHVSFSSSINSSRLELLNTIQDRTYSSTIVDLEDKEGNSVGTKVVVNFPLILEDSQEVEAD